jgi:ribose transport system substrate-binding protein
MIKVGFFGLANNTTTTALLDQAAKVGQGINATVVPVLNPFDPQEQQQQLQDAIAAHQFDAYILEPINPPALRPVFEQLVSQGIPFGTVELTNGTDNTTAKAQLPGQTIQVNRTPASTGMDLAKSTAEACGDVSPCKIALIAGVAALPVDQAQLKTFKSELASHPTCGWWRWPTAGTRTPADVSRRRICSSRTPI